MKYRLQRVEQLTGRSFADRFDSQELYNAPVSYTHLDVYKRQVKHLRCGAEGIPSLNRALSQYADPKPGDLSMSRSKLS